MTKDQVKMVLDRVLAWPEKRQEDLAEMVLEIEAQDRDPTHLTDEQLAELRRRRADRNAQTFDLAEWDKRLSRFGI
jgi:hypothetical protein